MKLCSIKLKTGLIISNLYLFFLIGCGDTQPKVNTETDLNQYFIVQPTNPPFIQFQDSNLGDVDNYKYEGDVIFPANPIPSVPNIGL
jgi:hypothetical protein